jgi:phosphosulfolactate synthase
MDHSLRLDGAPPPKAPPAPDFLDLPERTEKPRRTGLTHVLDRGLSVRALESLLETAGPHLDLLKLGWGTAYVSGGVRDKVALCRDAGVRICTGGTLLEIAVHQGRLDRYLDWLRELRIDHVEVSNGSLGMPRERKQEVIRRLAAEFIVLSEVGSKSTQPVAGEWGAEMLGDMAAGAVWVVAEGRESGTIGLFDESGEVHRELVEEIVHAVGAESIIFEAPQRAQAVWLLRHLGPNVNLGNIAPDDVVALETLRRGLRYDTLEFLPEAVRAP